MKKFNLFPIAITDSMFNFLKLFTKKRHNFFYLADLWYGMLIVYFTQYMVLYECLIEQNNDEQNIDEHKNIKYIIIHQTDSNIIILFVMFDKNQFIVIFWLQCH